MQQTFKTHRAGRNERRAAKYCKRGQASSSGVKGSRPVTQSSLMDGSLVLQTHTKFFCNLFAANIFGLIAVNK